MSIKEILMLAARNLGREDLAAHIAQEPTTAPQSVELAEEAACMLRCYHLVENEIALEHVPLERTEQLTVSDGTIAYSQFAAAPVDIVCVCDVRGAALGYTAEGTGLRLAAAVAEAEVTYSYAPPQGDFDDAPAFCDKISARLLSFGVAAEFLLTAGRYEEAAMWDERYRRALRAACAARGALRMPGRHWV